MRRESLAACCVIAASLLDAGEVAWTFGIESEPVAYAWTAERSGLRVQGDDEFAWHAGAFAGARLIAPLAGRWSFILGAEAAAGEAMDGSLGSLRWGELRLVQGVACRLAPRLDGTMLLRGGGGIDRLDAADTGSPAVADGRHAMFAAELGIALAVSARLSVLAGAGWRVSRTDVRDEASGLTVGIEQDGPTLSLGLAWNR